MRTIFEPTYRVKRVWGISPKALQLRGITTVLADLDNTLVAWNRPEGDLDFFDWHAKLQEAKINLIVVSNNSTARVKRAVTALGVPFESWSWKPLPRGIKKTLRDFDLSKDEVIMVGDQITTDIIASNLAGVRSVLVQPLTETDGFPTRINRQIAKIVTGRKEIRWEDDLIDPK
ncbi:MAG: YqeG family HAD IIIA-type phosphatase [Oenococcus sp.]|uniref:YqeG family HAD IIIA-type phosphatase n=1 Tax=Oenococcus TaxID=46254 RepID=UPI0021E700F2|nr:YqeG family HAD IIIA-type phosphatase [Oenococcus kitaharae]MCV3295705.1 YqeG family HAD IIIA-type phosphatase [Oenococcus kitaharae]